MPDSAAERKTRAKRFSIRSFAAKHRRVSYFINSPKVGRSQGASIFWGLISVCFAAAACFYYWKNHENETRATVMRDQVLQLTEEVETLNAQKEHLQASKVEAENQLKTREELVEEKETQLAAEETRLEGAGRQTQIQSQQNLAQVAMVKKFNDAIRKLGKDVGADVIERAGRPVLRIPNAQIFNPAESNLKPEGKALLSQLAQAISGQLDTFELRVVSYTDSAAEGSAGGQKKDAADGKATASPSWDLTAARAAALSRFYRDQTSLPFLNVLILGRGDSEPIAKEDPARNQRLEVTVTPLPVPFHAPDPDKGSATSAAGDDSSSAGDMPPAAKKDKPKDKKSDKTPGH